MEIENIQAREETQNIKFGWLRRLIKKINKNDQVDWSKKEMREKELLIQDLKTSHLDRCPWTLKQ